MRLFFAILFCVLSAPALVVGPLIVERGRSGEPCHRSCGDQSVFA